MSSHSESRILGFTAETDLSAKQFHAVKFGADDKSVVQAVAEEGFGILMSASPLGGGAEVAINGGGAKAKLAGTVARGASLTSDANGAFISAGVDARCLAVAMESGVTGDVIAVEVVIHSTVSV